jgi:outer membrane protein
MKLNRFISIIITLLAFSTSCFAMDSRAFIGIVNFMTCITDSKYGKNEQEQLENIKKQWTSLIEETEKELTEVNSKFEDQDYLDSLSPEAEEQLKIKQQTLQQDLGKYQNQLYQILNQANYFFIQKMSNNIAKASETIAQEKKLDIVLNKEACFYNNPKIDITALVIKEMDKNFDKETAKNETEKEKNAIAIPAEDKQQTSDDPKEAA